GMTGLELIERAKQAFPAVNFIVMSGYTEFQYAQTALRFGVWDYLLKPLKKAELNRALEKLDHELGDRAEQRQEAARVQNELQESMDILREQYVRTVWETGHTPTRSQRHGGELFVLDNAKLQCVTFCIDGNFTASSDEPFTGQSGERYARHIRALTGTALC
ncbi:MAG: response regulator, partial [Butyricicoccus sp.]